MRIFCGHFIPHNLYMRYEYKSILLRTQILNLNSVEIADMEKELSSKNVKINPKKLKATKFDKLDLIFILVLPTILGFTSLMISLYEFWGLLHKIVIVQTVNPEVISGLLSVSGIVFAFQAFFLKKPKKTVRRLVFAIIFLVEVSTLAFIGFGCVGDVSSGIFPRIPTFFLVFFSLSFTLATTAFFIIYDLFVPNAVEENK